MSHSEPVNVLYSSVSLLSLTPAPLACSCFQQEEKKLKPTQHPTEERQSESWIRIILNVSVHILSGDLIHIIINYIRRILNKHLRFKSILTMCCSNPIRLKPRCQSDIIPVVKNLWLEAFDTEWGGQYTSECIDLAPFGVSIIHFKRHSLSIFHQPEWVTRAAALDWSLPHWSRRDKSLQKMNTSRSQVKLRMKTWILLIRLKLLTGIKRIMNKSVKKHLQRQLKILQREGCEMDQDWVLELPHTWDSILQFFFFCCPCHYFVTSGKIWWTSSKLEATPVTLQRQTEIHLNLKFFFHILDVT